LSTPTTDTEFTGEENSTSTTTVPVETTEEHPPYEHRHEDGTVHYGFTPTCSGGCPHKPPTTP
jgi:hypothetical protein